MKSVSFKTDNEIENSGNIDLIINIERNWFKIVFNSFFLLLSLSAATLVVVSVVKNFKASSGLVLAWLIVWSFITFRMAKLLLWMVKGREIIVVKNGQLTITKKAAWFFKPKFYYTNKIKNLRVDSDLFKWHSRLTGGAYYEFGVFLSNTIYFDYDNKVEKFGTGLDQESAWNVIQLLHRECFIPLSVSDD